MNPLSELAALEGSHIVVKFVDGIGLPYNDDMEDYPTAHGLITWRQVSAAIPNISMRRMFTSVPVERIKKLVATANERDVTYMPTDLLSFFIVDLQPDEDIPSLLERLRSIPMVEEVYFDPPGEDPTGAAANNPLYFSQGYLQPEPEGIDAVYAWLFPGGDGADQEFIDMEKGWTLIHEDLVSHGTLTPLEGTIQNGSRLHGTAVLGEICASNNSSGVIGIAWNLGKLNVVSYYNSNRPNAIMKAVDVLPFGGVLLLEAQLPMVSHGMKTFNKIPIEVQHADFLAIRLATAIGVTVIEAGGNGGHNLDIVTDGNGKFVLDGSHTSATNHPNFRDSGAILVGAATSLAPHSRLESSHGRRVDCYAWGENVTTARTSTAAPFLTDKYRHDFGGTSSAAAIIAGAALSVQGLAEKNLGFRFSAFQMRKLLSDNSTGTLSMDPSTDRIGVMPDLRKVINDDTVGLAPDLYIRDSLADTGDPHNGQVSTSPDIILRPLAVANPQLSFGEGSGTENSNTLGAKAIAGQDNYVYVRVRNRGGAVATDARVDIYWSPVATLVAPDLWTLVGSANLAVVPAADPLTVFDAITWKAADIPATGHYCFVGVVGSGADPAPEIPADIDWGDFQRLIRDNNNVTWRNFNVVDLEQGQTNGIPGFAAMDFVAPGWRTDELRMNLEVVARLPHSSRVLLEMPAKMYDGLMYRFPALPDQPGKLKNTRLIQLNPHGRFVLERTTFPKGSRYELRLHVQIPEKDRANSYEVYARQVYEELEVGRITWRLAPSQKSTRVGQTGGNP